MPPAPEPRRARTPSGPLGLAAWALYDWANSVFPTVIVTFVFARYFTGAVAADATAGAAQWSYAFAASGVAIAVLAPVFGAIADKGGRRKPWIAAFGGLCVVTTALLVTIAPDPAYVLPALVLVAVANLGFEMSVVFNNAMLPDIVARERLGRLSGWAWGLGYAGGLTCLAIILVGFDTSSLDQVRATALLVAGWFAVFALPLFLWTPDQPAKRVAFASAAADGLRMLWDTLKRVRRYRNIALFLLAHMIYGDGLVTLFAMGGVFAGAAFGMSMGEVLQFGVAINVTAGLGAAAFGWVDDRIGSKRTILIALAGLVVTGAIVLNVEDKLVFLVLGSLLGIFVGPAQAASRSLLARIVPESQETEMFGLYALSGKATAFVGPTLFGVATEMFQSTRAGMATILVFFVAGAAVLLAVAEKRVEPAAPGV